VPQVGSSDLIAAFRERVSALKDQLNGISKPMPGQPPKVGLIDFQKTLLADRDKCKDNIDVKVSPKDPFSTRTDPTLCIAGLNSVWPADTMEVLEVRLDKELDNDISAIAAVLGKHVIPVTGDHGLAAIASKILVGCLRHGATQSPGDTGTTGFQSWADRNPFVSLYIEWEATYFHIAENTSGVEPWDVQLLPSPVGHTQSQIRYVPGTTLLASDPKTNTRNQDYFHVLSGRTSILPQPRFSLQDVILQIISNKSNTIPADLDQGFARGWFALDWHDNL
jgi:hypothetical protein